MRTYGAAPSNFGTRRLDFTELMHYLYLPVVMPGQAGVRLPRRLEFLRELVHECIADHAVNGGPVEYVYVTARRGFAGPGNPLNRPGFHTDGFGTDDINYVWTDRWPTVFAVQEFTGIAPSDHVTSLAAFEAQARETTEYHPLSLLRLDQYVVHAAPDVPAPGGMRSFVKVSFSTDRYAWWNARREAQR